MVVNGSKKALKCPIEFTCIFCDYNTIHKRDYTRHLATLKHQMMKNDSQKSLKSPNNNVCSCGKEYKFMSGLYRHRTVCKQYIQYNTNTNTDYLLEIIKSNQDLIIQQNKQISDLTTNTPISVQNIQNNNNITFNLNCFLNNTCKDALNMKDFIASIQVSFDDLENTGKNGFVKSMTRVITRELGKLEACMRPIHCSDVKRKVLHIKEDNSWQKDTETCANTKKMVCSIAHKTNVMQIPKWVTANPRSQINDDKLCDFYFKIVGNSMEGNDGTYEKIITGVSDKIRVGNNKQVMLLK